MRGKHDSPPQPSSAATWTSRPTPKPPKSGGEACQLVAQLTHLIPNADKWLDNLSEAKLVHKGLLPVIIKPSASPKSTGDAS
jgi:hypothetical protein